MNSINLKNVYSFLRNDETNILLLNYLLIGYLLSLLFAYEIDKHFINTIMVIFLFNENLKDRILFALSHKVVQAIILFFCVVVIWSVAAEDISLAIYHIKSFRYFLFSIIFVAIIRKDFINKFLYIFMIAMFFQVIYFYLMHFNILDSPFKVAQSFPFLYKFEHAFLVLLVLGISLYKIITIQDSNKLKIFLSIFFLLESFNIFLSGSRTGILLYSVMVLITLIFIFKNYLKKVFILTTALIFLLLIPILMFTPAKQDLQRAYFNIVKAIEFGEYNSSSGARVGLSIYAFQVFKEHPIFGIGTSNHLDYVKHKVDLDISKNPDINSNNQFEHVLLAVINTQYGHIHNTHLEILVQFGIVGFIIFLNIFYQVLRSRNFSEPSHIFFVLLLSILVLITMFIGFSFQFFNLPKFFILIISILTAKEYLIKRKPI
jgi:O-antigen ligase